jgi:Omp85 superfamily domain
MKGEVLAAVLALAVPVVATAETRAESVVIQDPVPPSPEPVASPAPETSPSLAPPEFVPTKDLIDVLRALLHKPPPPPAEPTDFKKRMVAGSPVVSYSPTSGAGIGVAGNIAFYKGYPETTRISSIVTSATVTTKSQFLVSAKMSASSPENRWRVEADNRFFWTSQPSYGLGTDTPDDAKLDMKFNHFRIFDKFYKQVFPNVFLGSGFVFNVHNNVRPGEDVDAETFDASPYVAYSKEYGFRIDSQTSAGISLHALVDSRDGAINPSRGWYASTSYLMSFQDFLGGTSNWQQFSYDLRGYARLTHDARQKLAFWTFGDLVTGGVAPYLDLPSTGGDTYSRSGRGYPQGRFRGERMLYAEAEYRATLTKNGLFGMVAFLNTETLSNDLEKQKLFDSFATGAGFGFRFMLNRRSNTNLCFDVGWGKQGSHAVYFAVQEAF